MIFSDFILFYFLPACRVSFSLAQRPLFLWSSPLMLQNLHYHRPWKQPPSMLYIDYIHVILLPKLYIIPTTDVQLAIILKRSCQKKERNFINICWNCWELNSQLIKNFFIVPTIGLLLEITAQRCTLHTFSSTVEIFENSFPSYRTLFSRIHKYLAKKYP